MIDLIEMQNNILKAMDVKINKRLKELKFDYTIDGKIISSDGDNKYTVKINNNETQIKTIDNKTYNIGDIVIIHVRRNNFSDKIILCKRP